MYLAQLYRFAAWIRSLDLPALAVAKRAQKTLAATRYAAK